MHIIYKFFDKENFLIYGRLAIKSSYYNMMSRGMIIIVYRLHNELKLTQLQCLHACWSSFPYTENYIIAALLGIPKILCSKFHDQAGLHLAKKSFGDKLKAFYTLCDVAKPFATSHNVQKALQLDYLSILSLFFPSIIINFSHTLGGSHCSYMIKVYTVIIAILTSDNIRYYSYIITMCVQKLLCIQLYVHYVIPG